MNAETKLLPLRECSEQVATALGQRSNGTISNAMLVVNTLKSITDADGSRKAYRINRRVRRRCTTGSGLLYDTPCMPRDVFAKVLERIEHLAAMADLRKAQQRVTGFVEYNGVGVDYASLELRMVAQYAAADAEITRAMLGQLR